MAPARLKKLMGYAGGTPDTSMGNPYGSAAGAVADPIGALIAAYQSVVPPATGAPHPGHMPPGYGGQPVVAPPPVAAPPPAGPPAAAPYAGWDTGHNAPSYAAWAPSAAPASSYTLPPAAPAGQGLWARMFGSAPPASPVPSDVTDAIAGTRYKEAEANAQRVTQDPNYQRTLNEAAFRAPSPPVDAVHDKTLPLQVRIAHGSMDASQLAALDIYNAANAKWAHTTAEALKAAGGNASDPAYIASRQQSDAELALANQQLVAGRQFNLMQLLATAGAGINGGGYGAAPPTP